MRVGDVLYRFGVDEFAVLLPATSAEDALPAAHRLRAAVDALALRPAGQGPLYLRTSVVPVAGVAEDVIFQAIRALASTSQEPTIDA
jgi:diguanylate cyclase (GGDEF)-like protein